MSTITIQLYDMAHGGDAVGRHRGKAVFVPLGIPGEKVRVEVTDERKRFAHARLLEVLEPSPERVSPPCQYFGLCGGCQWQHLAYDAQLRYKQQIVRAQLVRLGKQIDPVVRDVLGMDDPWGYRNHVQLQIDHLGRSGFYALRSHDVVPVGACCITHPLLDELWEALDVVSEGLYRIVLRAGIGTGEQMVIFEGDEVPELAVDIPVSCLYQFIDGGVIVLAGHSHYHERLAGRTLRVSGPSFFQVNTSQTERLVELVGTLGALEPDERLLDVYCGVGALTLSLADSAGSAVGIDSSPWAVADAVANAHDANVTFVEGDARVVLSNLRESFDAVVLNPPRAGCGPAVLAELVRCQPERIVYVSCDPATLARDVDELTSRGYRLIQAQPIDMFPQTYHVETVALLCRA